eukprot:CAMPEP_0117798768 /NCGR_PEP_ID=MMETSP0948-20121206/13353_1 /TAXON_ID=44440 /ORGANISM="Chattonella subsalsa, Strain CCMP2191" /LENGTH=201 /DNA_ID=CAMNT_0005630483 /DNA_START=40 /DNA_END=645 /DNA_ORIENTATION=+
MKKQSESHTACLIIALLLVSLCDQSLCFILHSKGHRTIKLEAAERNPKKSLTMKFYEVKTFVVKQENEVEFQEFWRGQQGTMENVSGFKQLVVLQATSNELDETTSLVADESETVKYLVKTTWAHNHDWKEWVERQAWVRKEGLKKSDTPGIFDSDDAVSAFLQSPPEACFYEEIFEEPKPAESFGEFDDWSENEMAYFDD